MSIPAETLKLNALFIRVIYGEIMEMFHIHLTLETNRRLYSESEAPNSGLVHLRTALRKTNRLDWK